MNNLIVQQASDISISSVDFLIEFINPSRLDAGEGVTRYSDFIARVIDELDLSHDEIFVMKTTGGRTRQFVNLDQDQMLLVGMRESKKVRKSVLAKLKELTKPKQDPIVLLAQKVLQQDAEIKLLEKTKAHINDKRTATVMGKLGAATKKIKSLEARFQELGTHISLKAAKLPQRIDTEFKMNVQTWRVLKQISDELGMPIKKVSDDNYGEVNTYHVDVIDAFKAEYM